MKKRDLHQPIVEFVGPWASLAMEGQTPFTYEGITYPSIYKGYYAYINLPNHWKCDRLQVMYLMSCAKAAQNPAVLSALEASGTRYLMDGQFYDYSFWGVDLGRFVGHNWLGRIWMHIREQQTAAAAAVYAPFCYRSMKIH